MLSSGFCGSGYQISHMETLMRDPAGSGWCTDLRGVDRDLQGRSRGNRLGLFRSNNTQHCQIVFCSVPNYPAPANVAISLCTLEGHDAL